MVFSSHFRYVISLPSGLTVSVEKSAVFLYSAPLKVMCLVFLLPFSGFFFCLFTSNLIMLYLCVSSLYFSFLGVAELFESMD